MTIKEIEARSGLTRANIRFYEAQGLITPRRAENGYRDYSEDDLTQLLRIRLLRGLDLSLEEIRDIQSGRRTLEDSLSLQLCRLDAREAQLDSAREVCLRLRRDGARYDTLDGALYLPLLESDLQADRLPRVQAPVRRFFARLLDLVLYLSLWACFLTLALNVNLNARENGYQIADWFVVLLLMLVLEPLWLRLWGTTPGKAILGLSVTDPDGGRLAYADGLERTLYALAYGLGMNLPLLRLWRLWKSCDACASGRELPWEENSLLVLRDTRPWRAAAYCGVWALLLGALMLSSWFVTGPRHRGDITAAEFADNFNHLADYHRVDPGLRLDPDGRWEDDGGAVISIFDTGWGEPEFRITQSHGRMTGLSFEMSRQDAGLWPPSLYTEQALILQSFVRARQGFFSSARELNGVLDQLRLHPYEDFACSVGGVRIRQDVEHSGYLAQGGALIPQEGQEQSFAYRFSMELE